MLFVRGAFAALWLMAAGPAFAQTAEQIAPAAPEAAAAPDTVRIPAGTVVQVELTEALSSKTNQQEQLFGLRLAAPIIIDGREVVAAGAAGGGEVIDAHPSAFGGRQGRLIISGRFVEINGQRARIRGMQMTAVGEHRANEALAVSMIPYAGIAGIFIQGGEIEIPAGARGTARLAEDVVIPAPPAEAAVTTVAEATIPSAAPAPEPSTSGENQQ